MQAIKEKIQDLKEIRKAKAEAKEEEKAERELAKARLEVAREVRMAREAEATMDYHVQKAAEKAAEHEKKFPQPMPQSGGTEQDIYDGDDIHESHGAAPSNINSSAPAAAASSPTNNLYSGGAAPDSGHDKATFLDAPSTPTDAVGYTTAPPNQNNNNLL